MVLSYIFTSCLKYWKHSFSAILSIHSWCLNGIQNWLKILFPMRFWRYWGTCDVHPWRKATPGSCKFWCWVGEQVQLDENDLNYFNLAIDVQLTLSSNMNWNSLCFSLLQWKGMQRKDSNAALRVRKNWTLTDDNPFERAFNQEGVLGCVIIEYWFIN